MKKLIAIGHVLYLSKQYKPGEELPANDSVMVEAWIKAGSAEWRSNATEETEIPKKAKAKPTTAQVGQVGIATPSGEEDLAGRIPSTPDREKE